MVQRRDPVKPFGRRTEPHRIIIDRGHSISHVTLPPWGLKGLAAAMVGIALWAVAATTMVVWNDSGLVTRVEDHADVQGAYEDRIDALRAQVDHLKTRSLVEQTAFQDKLERLLRRQASLESRAATLQSLDGMAQTLGLRDSAATQTEDPAAADAPPLDGLTITPGPARNAALGFAPAEKPTAKVGGTLGAVESSLSDIETRQLATIAGLESKARDKAGRIRDVVASIGLDADKLAAAQSSEGGPYIPLEPANATDPFTAQALTTQEAMQEVERLKKAVSTLPLRRPFPDAAITSGFGARSDPFLGTMAMHAGVDFREDQGATVHPTAAGVVTEASWAGGYGNMVEIDHGNGLTTRYGHLSKISVQVGDHVTIKTKIGEVGSTGRSTGPHLHYETRVAGEAVDPTRFLRAGRRING